MNVWIFFRVAAVVLHGTVGGAIFRNKKPTNNKKTTTITTTTTKPQHFIKL